MWAGKERISLDIVDSTNEYAKRIVNQGACHGTLIIAREQTAGKGRRGRQWRSPPGKDIYMSLLLKPRIQPERASVLTLIAAMAVTEAIRECIKINVLIKWPNDILYEDKKLCGILCEMEIALGKIAFAVVGMGINVNTKELPQALKNTATSLAICTGKTIDTEKLIDEIMAAFERYYDIYSEQGGFASLRPQYESWSANIGRKVTILNGSESFTGKAQGINETGELIVENEMGETILVSSGEVSLRSFRED